MSARHGSRLAAVNGVCTAAFLLFLGGATAAAQTSGQVHACVQKGSQQTRIVGDGEGCKSTESRIVWSVQGTKGDKGDPGATGGTGPAGPTGPKGDKGDTGDRGAAGAPGAEGGQGVQGVPGPKGETGPTGNGLATGSIKGRLEQCGPTANVGVAYAIISVAGHSFTAATDALGNFEFSYLPTGVYELIPPPFFVSANPVAVTAGQVTQLAPILINNLQADTFNCGVCGNSCGATGRCVAGVCTTTSCSPPFVPGTAPGTCICPSGTTGANCEISVCPALTPVRCPDGSCAVTPVTCPVVCGPGQTSCNGGCTSTATDFNNCGGCNLRCGAGQVCANGLCAGNPTPSCSNAIKDGSETGIDCGGTCNACNPGVACVAGNDCTSKICAGGVCQVPSCSDSIKNGTETGVDCGGTCVACAAQTCTAGADCPSGGPNTVGSCSAGICSSVCTAGFSNCDGNPATGCEANLNTNVNNCGACGRACGVGGTCVNGSCLVSPNLCAGVTCPALDQCHLPGACNPSTGVCSNPVSANGTACSDGNACTQLDSCQAGTCTGAAPIVCPGTATCNPATGCSSGTGALGEPNAGVSVLQAIVDARRSGA